MTRTVVRTRNATSPTGYLHIGGAWYAFFVWLFARHHQGVHILRIEDTDRSRSTLEFERAYLEDLRWLGLDWDEGPDVGGPYGPYRQTERLDIYRAHAQRLVTEGAAYPCYCTREELEAERRRAREQGRSYRYSRRCLHLTADERARFAREGRRPAVRFLVREGRTIVVEDLIRGRVEFSTNELDDFVIVRSTGVPLYNFANVVDDHTMAITHIVRGAQHLSNTPRQWMLYEALGWTPPLVAHLPEILGTDRKKLSKRTGDVALRDYRRDGYLPEALLNFFALMGWYPEEDRELYAVEELVRRFRLDDVGRSPAVFDLTKLTWMNGVYMRRLLDTDPGRVVDVCAGVLQAHGLLQEPVDEETRVYVRRVVEVLGDRLKVGRDIIAYGDFFFRDVGEYEPKALDLLRRPAAADLLRALANVVASAQEWDRDAAETAVRGLAADRGIDGRAIIHPARAALTGKTAGPGLFELMGLLGRERVVARLRAAADRAEMPAASGV